MVSQAPGYGLMTPDAGAGPGMLPLLTGLGLVASAIIIILVSSASEPLELPPDVVPDRAGMLRLIGVVGAFALVILVIEQIGYRLTMFLFLVSTMVMLGRRDWPIILGVALVGSLGVYWVFTDKLLVLLPRGILGF